jgi:hypothetical protein
LFTAPVRFYLAAASSWPASAGHALPTIGPEREKLR